jgi:hypothetical protein
MNRLHFAIEHQRTVWYDAFTLGSVDQLDVDVDSVGFRSVEAPEDSNVFVIFLAIGRILVSGFKVVDALRIKFQVPRRDFAIDKALIVVQDLPLAGAMGKVGRGSLQRLRSNPVEAAGLVQPYKAVGIDPVPPGDLFSVDHDNFGVRELVEEGIDKGQGGSPGTDHQVVALERISLFFVRASY